MMKSEKVSDNNHVVIRSAYVSRAIPLTEINTNKKPPMCFQSDERYFCQKNCGWKCSCKALTAAWLRKN